MASSSRDEEYGLVIRDLQTRVTKLEGKMSTVQDVVSQLDAATNTIADKLTRLQEQVAGSDAALASEFEPVIARLRALGSDPANPVPTDPTPSDPNVTP